MAIKRLSIIEMLLSLLTLIRETWHWLSLSIFSVSGPMIWYWRQLQYLETQIGWGLYPFVGAFTFAAIVGVWLTILFLRKRIKILSKIDNLINEDRKGIEELADNALELATEISELIGDHQTPPPTLYDHSSGSMDMWQRDMHEIRSRMMQKFMMKYMVRSQSIMLLASRYLPISEKHISWVFTHISSDHQVAEVRGMLIKVSIDLKEKLKIPVEYTLPHIPSYYEDQRELPLREGLQQKKAISGEKNHTNDKK